MDNEEFLNSRYDFVNYLNNQVSLNTSEPLYKRTATATRAALLGVAKSEIEKLLKEDPRFISNMKLMENSSLVTDPFEKAQILEFRDFYDSLQAMQDLERPTSIRQELSDRLSAKYSDVDSALYELQNDGTPKEIFEALKDSASWREDADDFTTRDYVDLPDSRQLAKWAAFSEIVDLINDLKYLN